MARTTKTPAIVTKDSLRSMLAAADFEKQCQIVGRALVVLFNRQTSTEKSADATSEDNNQGFASCDAFGGSLSAKSFLKNRSLASWQLQKWTKVMSNGYPKLCKYHRQLNEAAMERAQARDGQQQSLLV